MIPTAAPTPERTPHPAVVGVEMPPQEGSATQQMRIPSAPAPVVALHRNRIDFPLTPFRFLSDRDPAHTPLTPTETRVLLKLLETAGPLAFESNVKDGKTIEEHRANVTTAVTALGVTLSHLSELTRAGTRVTAVIPTLRAMLATPLSETAANSVLRANVSGDEHELRTLVDDIVALYGATTDSQGTMVWTTLWTPPEVKIFGHFYAAGGSSQLLPLVQECIPAAVAAIRAHQAIHQSPELKALLSLKRPDMCRIGQLLQQPDTAAYFHLNSDRLKEIFASPWIGQGDQLALEALLNETRTKTIRLSRTLDRLHEKWQYSQVALESVSGFLELLRERRDIPKDHSLIHAGSGKRFFDVLIKEAPEKATDLVTALLVHRFGRPALSVSQSWRTHRALSALTASITQRLCEMLPNEHTSATAHADGPTTHERRELAALACALHSAQQTGLVARCENIRWRRTPEYHVTRVYAAQAPQVLQNRFFERAPRLPFDRSITKAAVAEYLQQLQDTLGNAL